MYIHAHTYMYMYMYMYMYIHTYIQEDTLKRANLHQKACLSRTSHKFKAETLECLALRTQ